MHILSEKFIIYLYELYKHVEMLTSFSDLFRSDCKLILFSTTMYVYCVYPTILKSPKTKNKNFQVSISE